MSPNRSGSHGRLSGRRAAGRVAAVALATLPTVGAALTPTPVTTAPVATATAAPVALLKRTTDGAAPSIGLAASIAAGIVPKWPVELVPVDAARRACGADCGQWQRVELAVVRAAQWLSAYPSDKLRFDAAVIVSGIRETVDTAALRSAFEAAHLAADRDDDNPQRRFWLPDFQAPRQHTSTWKVPTGTERVNPNRVLSEVLFCREYGLRPETVQYVCGAMRDDGGYATTHALWGLSIANRNGCIAATDYTPCAQSIQLELAKKQPAPFAPQATLDIDLYAERLLYVVVTGFPDPVVDGWAETLVRLQGPDGSWGIVTAGEDPYYRYHATAMTTWALAEWYRRMIGLAAK